MSRTRRLILALLLLKGLWLAFARTGGEASLAGADRADLVGRLGHLEGRLLDPAFFDEAIASPGGIFEGEWRLVSLSMTAAAATNLAQLDLLDRTRAVALVDALVARAREPAARAFDQRMWGSDALATLDRDEGHVGYLGHLAFMTAARLTLGEDAARRAELREITDTLARRMQGRASHHLETYPGEIYVADNVVAVAALALGGEHRALVADWVRWSREHLLVEHGLLAFGLDREQQPTGGGRGSAAGWNSFYLPFVDEAFAAEQRRAFAALRVGALGLAAFREHDTAWALGDVDSGPLLFGISPAATGFGIAAARHDRDPALLSGLLATAELAGFTVPADRQAETSCYLLAPLVGDAIVLAMRTATRWRPTPWRPTPWRLTPAD
ncbi:MAG: hypothetical protein R3B72_41265 [Polyangiaceae bacterium]